MENLYITYETLTNGYKPIFLDTVTILSIISGIFVIITRNPIISVLFLIGLFINISGYLILIGINFIGLAYLLVYVGAVSILFLFILMLINIRISELHEDNNNSVPLGFLFGIAFYYPLFTILPSTLTLNKYPLSGFINWINSILLKNKTSLNAIDNIEIDLSSSIKWDGNIVYYTEISSIGNIMYTSYSIWLIVVSIILLLAMVGAIVVTIKPLENN